MVNFELGIEFTIWSLFSIPPASHFSRPRYAGGGLGRGLCLTPNERGSLLIMMN